MLRPFIRVDESWRSTEGISCPLNITGQMLMRSAAPLYRDKQICVCSTAGCQGFHSLVSGVVTLVSFSHADLPVRKQQSCNSAFHGHCPVFGGRHHRFPEGDAASSVTAPYQYQYVMLTLIGHVISHDKETEKTKIIA